MPFHEEQWPWITRISHAYHQSSSQMGCSRHSAVPKVRYGQRRLDTSGSRILRNPQDPWGSALPSAIQHREGSSEICFRHCLVRARGASASTIRKNTLCRRVPPRPLRHPFYLRVCVCARVCAQRGERAMQTLFSIANRTRGSEGQPGMPAMPKEATR